ncbi:uncharacterized protein [Parasteatoda tepidariorum]|uniref:uncharacterized protein n=1 Tax=Parasteatoda tepidariorum TaxID=114398 RepID=UPI00077FA755|nr:uncharacterized protein LOC107437705 [Parasteatoda tepidariorum]
MLRAIAGYILGGILSDPPQETLECETQEVNDWLVVNMPNKLDESDLDFESDTESEIDEDDILACLPILMTVDELEYNDSLDAQVSLDNIPRSSLIPEDIMRGSMILQYNSAQCASDLLANENTYVYPYLPQNKCCQLMITYPGYEYSWKDSLDKTAAVKILKKLRAYRQENSKKSNTNPELTCNPVQTPTYINHRPPVASSKTDLLQQIKEIQPSQKAKEIALKKHVTRSQLNRQNKNYIYCTSAKTNRRKDLQRNHSGANNNRKCY